MELNKLFKYRSVWMAIAIIWIVIYHSSIIIPNNLINAIKKIGYGGVDIFIFASGLGCYYSLSKNSNINEFLKRRFKKIMPTFWCFLVFYITYKILNGGISVSAIIGNILCIQTFTFKGNDFNWYISCIWLLYFLAPYIYLHTNKIKTKWNAFIYLIFSLLFTIPFFKCNNLIIMITRIPLFFIGMYFAKLSMDKDYKLSKKSILIFVLLMIIGLVFFKMCQTYLSKYLWSYGLYWYPFILITPGLCIIISLICKVIDNNKFGKKIINFFNIIGKNTFEVYLVHSFIFVEIKNKIKEGVLNNSNYLWLKCIIIAIVLSVVLKYITKLIMYILKKIYNKTISSKLQKVA